MMQLTAAQRAKLERIVAAGGLTDEADVVRVPVSPPDPDLATAWKRYANRNYDSLVALAERVCGPLDLVLFDGDTLTVCRHPKSGVKADRLRAEVFLQVGERLFGEVTWSAMEDGAQPRLKITLGEEAPPSLAPALRLISGQPEPELQPVAPPAPEKAEPASKAADVTMRRVQTPTGKSAVWVSSPMQPAELAHRDYHRPDADLLKLDLSIISQAAGIAQRMIAEGAPPVQLMFPININNFRKPAHRIELLAALRKISVANAARLEPVLVRCEQGAPQSVVMEASGYLRASFNLVWVYAARTSDPRNYLWADMRMGVLVDSAHARENGLSAWRLAAEKNGWAIAILS